VRGPPDLDALVRHRVRHLDHAWHPTLPWLAVARRWPRAQIRDTDGNVIDVLPRGFGPIARSPDGTRLVGGYERGLALCAFDRGP
jgi:hypothetical protein